MAAYTACRPARSLTPEFTCAFSRCPEAMAASGGSRAKVMATRRQLGSTVALARATMTVLRANLFSTSQRAHGCAVLATPLVAEKRRSHRPVKQRNDLTKRSSEPLTGVKIYFR